MVAKSEDQLREVAKEALVDVQLPCPGAKLLENREQADE